MSGTADALVGALSGTQTREGMAKALREVEGRCLQLQGLTKRLAKFVGEARETNLLPTHMRAEAQSLVEQAAGLLR